MEAALPPPPMEGGEPPPQSFLAFLQGIPSQAKGRLRVVRELARRWGLGNSEGPSPPLSPICQGLQAQVPPTTSRYQVLARAIGQLRVVCLQGSSPLSSAGRVRVRAKDYYSVAAGQAPAQRRCLPPEPASESALSGAVPWGSGPVEETWRASSQRGGLGQAGGDGVTVERAPGPGPLQQALAGRGWGRNLSRQRLSAWAQGLASTIRDCRGTP